MAFRADVENYGVEQIYAHNMRFDNGALNNTERWLTKSKYRFFCHGNTPPRLLQCAYIVYDDFVNLNFVDFAHAVSRHG